MEGPLKDVPAVALGNGSRWSCAAPDLESKVTASNSSGPRMLGCVVWWSAAGVLAASGAGKRGDAVPTLREGVAIGF